MHVKPQLTIDPQHPLTRAVSGCVFALGLVMIGGCASPFSYTRAVHQEETRFVRLDARYGKGQDGMALRFAHPLTSREQAWSGVLEQIVVKPRKAFLSFVAAQDSPSLAFNEIDRQYLAKYLSEAFARARPDEWVVFYLSRSREPGIIEVSSGGFFVEGGWLHLVLANYRQPVSMPFIQQRIWEEPLRPVGDVFYELVPQRDQTVRTERRSDLTQSLLGEVSVLVLDQSAVSAKAQNTVAPGSIVQSGKKPGRQEETAGVEDQLRRLRRLFEEGLITEDDYRQKRQKLLEQL
ncbi:MAG: SHOCT domain-containing protein [Nitrospiraceae bacterium]